MYCPPLDSTLVAEIVAENVNDESDINTCIDILNSLAEGATLVLDSEQRGYGESELFSENSNDDKSASESSSGENEDESATSLEPQMDSLSLGEEGGVGGGIGDDSNNNYYYYYRDDDLVILDDNEFDNEFEPFILSKDDYKSIDSPTGFLKECFPLISTTRIEQLFQENDDDAETGQEYDQEMKTWNLRYVMSSTEQQRNGKNIIDLHGLTVDQAVYVVKKHLNRLYPKGDIYSGKPLKIITGVGNHSPNGIPKLPNAVRQVLKNNWDFVENRGHMIVKGQIFNI
nr:10366_t:CDS:2 [Entrophospora candida]